MSVNILDSYLAAVFTIPKTKVILRVSYQTLKVQLLEPPHDTKCGNYPLGSSEMDLTYKKIRNEVVKIFNRSLSDVMIYEPLDTPILSAYQLKKNEALRMIYRSMVEKNMQNMPKTCFPITTVPRAFTITYPSLGITVMWPNGCHISNESRAKLVFIDYFIYICSCVGIWFGLSVFGLFDLIERFKVRLYPKEITSSLDNNQRQASVFSHPIGGIDRKDVRLNRIEAKFDIFVYQMRLLMGHLPVASVRPEISV